MNNENTSPEPVMTVEWWKTAVLSLTLATVAVVTAFGGWHPTQDQITATTAAGAALVAVVFPLIAFFVRKRVTPNENVALTKSDAQLIQAAAQPVVTFTAPGKTMYSEGEING